MSLTSKKLHSFIHTHASISNICSEKYMLLQIKVNYQYRSIYYTVFLGEKIITNGIRKPKEFR